MITNPLVAIEVLSPGTEKRDRGSKFKAYKALPLLQEYVLIGSEYKAIEVHRREVGSGVLAETQLLATRLTPKGELLTHGIPCFEIVQGRLLDTFGDEERM